MIKNLKMGFKVMRYSYNWKINIVMGILFALIGAVMLLVDGLMGMGMLGGYLMMCASLMMVQSLYSMSVSNMVLASPLRKKVQTVIPVVLGGSGMLVMYLVAIVIYCIEILINKDMIVIACNSLIILSIVMFVMMLYIVVAYKYFAVSILVFAAVYVCFGNYDSVFARNPSWIAWETSYGSFALAAVIGLVVWGIGVFMAYLLSLLVYRMPLSKMAMTPVLRKQM